MDEQKSSTSNNEVTDTTSDLSFVVQQEEVAAERAERIKEYQRQLQAENNQVDAFGKEKRLNLFADGDSWFDYPLPLPTRSDVCEQLRHVGNLSPIILSLAHHGDASTSTLGVTKRQRIIDTLSNEGPFDGILFSGGGDDIVGDQFCLWVKSKQHSIAAEDGLNIARFRDMLGVVESAYIDLIEVRDLKAPGVPIFVHAYDFAQPTGKGVCTVGPWLKPSLVYKGWADLEEGAIIVASALKEFDRLLTSIESRYADFIYVRTQGALTPSSDWANELHPTPDGFKKIASKFYVALKTRFPDRI